MVICWDWSKDPGPTTGGEILRHFFLRMCKMKELSVFVDESGVFGPYEYHSQFYIVTLIFHDQSIDIYKDINRLNNELINFNLPDHIIHTGPLIRREFDYDRYSLLERKRIFNILYNFVRVTNITYHSFLIEKKQLNDTIDLMVKITKNLKSFLNNNIETFLSYDCIIVYYDNGQRELNSILVSVFHSILNNVKFKKPKDSPADYKLFQAADMLCTLELLSEKSKRKILSNSEIAFFSSAKDIYKSYLKAIQKKKFGLKEQ